MGALAQRRYTNDVQRRTRNTIHCDTAFDEVVSRHFQAHRAVLAHGESRSKKKLFDCVTMTFPSVRKEETPTVRNLTVEDVNAMLVELNIKLKARQRADGLFEIRPTIGGVRHSFYGHTADEIAKKYRQFLNEKKRTPTVKTTLFAWFDEWIATYKKPNVAENTYLNILRCVEKHLKPNLENKSLSRYTLTELTNALNVIESTRMRKYARGILREAFNTAISAGKCTTSPAQNLFPVKHVSQKGKAFALTELKELLVRASTTLQREQFLYYVFCLFAGTRRDEACSLKKTDCDFKNKIIYIRGTKSETSNRRVPMFPILEKLLRERLQESGETVFNISAPRADRLFQIFRGEKTDAVLHWLRHTFGTVQICVNRIPINTVSLWLGHADVSMTVKNYTHPEDLAPDIYFSGTYTEEEKLTILQSRYNEIISFVEEML